MREIVSSGSLRLLENPHDGIDYTLTNRNESVLLPLNEEDLDDLLELIEVEISDTIQMNGSVEVNRLALATLADEAADNIPSYGGDYADELSDSVDSAYNALDYER